MEALRKVLVVDDDPVVGKSFERVLGARGYAVICAGGGEEALDRLRREDYDVVYTDIKMPGMSGLEVAERIRADQPWLPVVIITGYGTDANENRARAAGVVGFLRKPLAPEQIESSAQDALLVRDALAAAVVPAPVAVAQAIVAPAEAARLARFAKNLALFAAAPFIGLAYVIAMPFVGIGMLAWLGIRAAIGRGKEK